MTKASDSSKSKSHRMWATKAITYTENVFRRHGEFISSHPYSVILGAILCTCLCGLGFMNIHMETRLEKLWISQDSDFVETLEWQRERFPDRNRFALIMFEAKNVLEPVNMLKMMNITGKVPSVNFTNNEGVISSQEDFCRKIPALGRKTMDQFNFLKSFFTGGDSAKTAIQDDLSSEPSDLSLQLDRHSYCQLFELMPHSCLAFGIDEIWGPGSADPNWTNQAVINDINLAKRSATFSFPLNFTRFLGGVKRNSSGHVVEAKAALFVFIMEVDMEAVARRRKEKKKKLSGGFSSDVNEGLYDWEKAFVEMVLGERQFLPSGLSVYPQTIRSFSEVSEDTIFDDVILLGIGVAILSTYLFIAFGRFSCVETRPFLSFMGLFSVFLSVIMSFGLCAGMGLVYCPIHSILPLLLLGLGVDDMFVIVQSFTNFQKKYEWVEKPAKLKTRMSEAFKNAGTAITVTSLTDFSAFLIGSFTSLPALRSFCLYAAVGILVLYFMQITFFLAAFVIDQERLEARRNGFLFCVKHQPSATKVKDLAFYEPIFRFVFSKILLKTAAKVAVLIMTLLVTSVCIWGTLGLRQEFNVIWFIPESSYVYQFMTKLKIYYPEAGNIGNAYVEDIKLPQELPKMKWLTEQMKESPWIYTVDSWVPPYLEYTGEYLLEDVSNANMSESVFSETLIKFLFSRRGAKYQSHFLFDGALTCDGDLPAIKASKLHYRHRMIIDREDQIQAMEHTKKIIVDANFTGHAVCTSLSYSEWESNKLIVKELVQNLSLALTAVFLMASLLILNLGASLLVMVCVGLTLVDVMALMTWWGLTIDTVTCINLVLCVGLSVDYSAHIALHFMKVEGTRNERVLRTMTEVGPPVFNGAFSTFLAFVFLAYSQSHVFESFFKIFFGVFIFGVFHGLVFLPVVLSVCGPASYKRADGTPESYAKTKVIYEAVELKNNVKINSDFS